MFIKTNSENVITDCIAYEVEGYIEIQLDEVPIGINGGWFKYENGAVLEYPDLKPKNESEEIEVLKNQLADLWNVVLTGGL
ncbi:hypothetical protein [Jeotgalibacillus aurantiacus]|uniref:hypothetical protein n=1 Tax=Jeotgalibacillus aurantiacus TaxID=2763266 RepID=UPI001D0A080C|nr:hypothetical protein [Jeotgalibacillus aurantiacus]